MIDEVIWQIELHSADNAPSLLALVRYDTGFYVWIGTGSDTVLMSCFAVLDSDLAVILAKEILKENGRRIK